MYIGQSQTPNSSHLPLFFLSVHIFVPYVYVSISAFKQVHLYHFSRFHIYSDGQKAQKRCSTSLIIREIQIKATMRYRLTLVRMAIIKKSTNSKYWRGCGENGVFLYCWWESKLIQPLWRTVWRFLKNWKNYHMTQQSWYWAYILRKPKLKQTHEPQCSLQDY